jgi:hypothetical protein
VDGVYFQPTNLDVYTYRRPGFWRRQFDDATTKTQFRFDIAFGLVVPVLCFVFDPGVFHGWLIGEGIYGRFQFFVYASSAVEIVTLACWLFAVRRFPAWSRPAGGVMLAGALFSFMLGVAMLPLSLLGLVLFGLGALGFIPFLTAVVYLRNGVRALRLNRATAPVRGGAAAAFAFGLVVALGVPAAAQVGARRAVRSTFARVAEGEELSPRRACALRVLALVSGASFDDVARRYGRETDPARRERLAEAYAELTGGDIEARYNRLTD